MLSHSNNSQFEVKNMFQHAKITSSKIDFKTRLVIIYTSYDDET